MHKYHKSCFSLISPFNGLLQHYDLKFSENSYLRHFSAQVSQIVFLAYLTVLRLFTTVWPKMSENSYLRHFSAQVSQSVFLIYLTVLRLITTVWTEMSENSYLRHFSAQVSQNVFLAYLTVLRLITTVWQLKCQKTHNGLLQYYDLKFSSYLRTSITNCS